MHPNLEPSHQDRIIAIVREAAARDRESLQVVRCSNNDLIDIVIPPSFFV